MPIMTKKHRIQLADPQGGRSPTAGAASRQDKGRWSSRRKTEVAVAHGPVAALGHHRMAPASGHPEPHPRIAVAVVAGCLAWQSLPFRPDAFRGARRRACRTHARPVYAPEVPVDHALLVQAYAKRLGYAREGVVPAPAADAVVDALPAAERCCGRSRHGAPVLSIQSIPLRVVRWSFPRPPRSCF